MTTLNARANQAYYQVGEEWNREHPDWEWMGYDHQRDAFEDGWERGYRAAEADSPGYVFMEGAAAEAVRLNPDLLSRAVREFADKHGIPLPEDD